jgi:excisionase family DNA binding protein
MKSDRAKPVVYTTGQAAAIAGVDLSTVWRWCKAGRLPGAWRTPGGQIRIPAETLAAALDHEVGQEE